MNRKAFVISALLLAATTVAAVFIARRGNPVVVQTNLEKLPMQIAGYKGTPDFFPQSVYDELNTDKSVYRHYRSADGRQINLYIGYYGTAKGGRTGHNPYACLPGAGWGILKAHRIWIHSPKSHKKWEVNYILSGKGDVQKVVLHWYQSTRDKVLANGLQQNIHRFISRILKNRNDGAFVEISALTSPKNIQSTQKRVSAFTAAILNLLPDYWPVEKG